MCPSKFCLIPAEHSGRTPLLNLGFSVMDPWPVITFLFKI